VPFASRTDALLAQNLELFLRQEAPAQLGGREHLAYRSAHYPVKSVIDGDLCEAYARLPAERQHQGAQLLDVPSPAVLLAKIQAIRSSIGF
jgi:splicing factor 3B subunit 3